MGIADFPSDPPSTVGPRVSLWGELKKAARDGVVLGVKYGLAVAGILLALSWIFNDYQVLRGRAQNGQVAFEFLQRQGQAQQTAQKVPPAAPTAPVEPAVPTK